MTRKRMIIISAVLLAAVLLVAGWFFFIRARYTGVINAMPDDVVCFFDIENTKEFGAFIMQDPAMQSLGTLDLFGNMYEDYALYSAIVSAHPGLHTDFVNKRVLAGAFATGKDEVDYLFLLDLDAAKRFRAKTFLPELDGQRPQVQSHTFEKETIYELRYPELNIAFSFATVNRIFLYSTTPVLVENAILQLKKGDPVSEESSFSAVNDALGNEQPFAIYLHLPKLSEFLARYAGNTQYVSVMQIAAYADWIGLQVESKPNGLVLNGYCAANEKENKTISGYSGVFSADMHPAVPGNTAVLYRVQTEQLAERMATRMTGEILNRSFFDHWSPWLSSQILVGISESLDQNVLKKSFMILPAADAKLGMSKISQIGVRDSIPYRDVDLFAIAAGELISKLSGIKAPDTCYGAWLSEALVVTYDKQQLRQMIDAYSNRTTLALQDEYRNFRTEVSASFNNSIYLNMRATEQLIRGLISDKHMDSLAGNFNLLRQFPKMEVQFTAHKDLYMVNGFIQYTTSAERSAGTLWSIALDAPIAEGPFTVFNQVTGQRNILVQDTLHQIYLVSAGGDVVWKKPLTSPIMSVVHEVDFYGNDKTQFLFNTREAIHLLDIYGEPVEGFPITLTTHMTSPVSVFMSARNDYRFFVACANNNIYGYYKDGKPIAGWNPMRNAGSVHLPLFSLPTVKGQAIGSVNDHMIEMRNATGASLSRIPVTAPIAEVVRIDSTIYCLDTTGTLITISNALMPVVIRPESTYTFAGMLPVPWDSSAAILTVEDGYIKLKRIGSDENIYIAEPRGQVNGLLAFKGVSGPVCGYTTSDGQIVLLDALGRPEKGFPVIGSSDAVVDDLTRSGDNILITISGNRLIAYRIQ